MIAWHRDFEAHSGNKLKGDASRSISIPWLDGMPSDVSKWRRP